MPHGRTERPGEFTPPPGRANLPASGLPLAAELSNIKTPVRFESESKVPITPWPSEFAAAVVPFPHPTGTVAIDPPDPLCGPTVKLAPVAATQATAHDT